MKILTEEDLLKLEKEHEEIENDCNIICQKIKSLNSVEYKGYRLNMVNCFEKFNTKIIKNAPIINFNYCKSISEEKELNEKRECFILHSTLAFEILKNKAIYDYCDFYMAKDAKFYFLNTAKQYLNLAKLKYNNLVIVDNPIVINKAFHKYDTRRSQFCEAFIRYKQAEHGITNFKNKYVLFTMMNYVMDILSDILNTRYYLECKDGHCEEINFEDNFNEELKLIKDNIVL